MVRTTGVKINNVCCIYEAVEVVHVKLCLCYLYARLYIYVYSVTYLYCLKYITIMRIMCAIIAIQNMPVTLTI